MERFAGYFDYNLDHYIHLEFTDARLKMVFALVSALALA